MFDVLWSMIIGIVGGIISSVIVSRVFMILGEYQKEMAFIEDLMRKTEVISGYLRLCDGVWEISDKETTRIKKEMKENNFKTEQEYFASHPENKWFPSHNFIKFTMKQLCIEAETTGKDIQYSHLRNADLKELSHSIDKFVAKIITLEEISPADVSGLLEDRNKLLSEYNICKRLSSKQITLLFFKDKIMITLFCVILLIVSLTVLSFILGI